MTNDVDEGQMMKRIAGYGRLIETKKEKKLVNRNFKRRNIGNNLLGINFLYFLRFLSFLSTHHSHMASSHPSTSLLSINHGCSLQFRLMLQLQLQLQLIPQPILYSRLFE